MFVAKWRYKREVEALLSSEKMRKLDENLLILHGIDKPKYHGLEFHGAGNFFDFHRNEVNGLLSDILKEESKLRALISRYNKKEFK